ncbi:copper chaperone PCu(A)C [Endozoicomonas elysicola]|uniref:copper chaperone PCu(A)C n=1 Tax=Endozoicomonas elysicola TaxID=305900 RepID=UPI0003A46D67|nr:copper chaperone PCu(A)C [Endozoicomonas elysicola]
MEGGTILYSRVVRIMRTIVNSVMALMVLLTVHTAVAAQNDHSHSHSHAHSQEHSKQELQLLNASARATKPGMSSSAAYMTIKNGTHEAVQIRSLSSPVAKKTELHTTEMNNGMMTMRRVDNVTIKSGDKLELKPGGYHVMLMGLKKPIATNSKVPVTITFSNGDKKTVIAHATDEIKGQHMAH